LPPDAFIAGAQAASALAFASKRKICNSLFFSSEARLTSLVFLRLGLPMTGATYQFSF
jgi:hypothetical protein